MSLIVEWKCMSVFLNGFLCNNKTSPSSFHTSKPNSPFVKFAMTSFVRPTKIKQVLRVSIDSLISELIKGGEWTMWREQLDLWRLVGGLIPKKLKYQIKYIKSQLYNKSGHYRCIYFMGATVLIRWKYAIWNLQRRPSWPDWKEHIKYYKYQSYLR